MKPVALVVEAITNSSNEGDIVLDTFGGGGQHLSLQRRLVEFAICKRLTRNSLM